jgi:hypothetical protein
VLSSTNYIGELGFNSSRGVMVLLLCVGSQNAQPEQVQALSVERIIRRELIVPLYLSRLGIERQH